jgi:IMP dehydrogenase
MDYEEFNEDLAFADIALEEQYTEIDSRADVSLKTDMGQFSMNLPVFSANMPQITEAKMCATMAKYGGMGVLHRHDRFKDDIQANVDEFEATYKKIVEKTNCIPDISPLKFAVSVGVKGMEKERFQELYNAGAQVFCIDVAHGNSKSMKDMITWVKSAYPHVTLIAGNVASAEGARNLSEWGADIIKVGIGPGSVCRTRSRTGVGKPQFSAILDSCRELQRINSDAKVIADGGITDVGDIAKALAGGADAVMVGAVLSGTTETPGRVYPVAGTNLVDREWYKVYGGSASAENKSTENGKVRFVEGEMKTVPFKGKAKYLLSDIKEGVQSAFSYQCAKNPEEFHAKVKWRRISVAGRIESKI